MLRAFLHGFDFFGVYVWGLGFSGYLHDMESKASPARSSFV